MQDTFQTRAWLAFGNSLHTFFITQQGGWSCPAVFSLWELEMRTTKTRAVTLGGLTIGGGAPVMVQSMTNTDTRDVPATLPDRASGCARLRSRAAGRAGGSGGQSSDCNPRRRVTAAYRRHSF